MLWTQSLICFAAWIGLGLAMKRRSQGLVHWVRGWSRQKRVLFSTVGLIASGILLAGGLFLIQQAGGIVHESLTTPAWVAVFLLGSVFTVVQVISATAMTTLIVEPSKNATRPNEEGSQ